MTLMRNIEEMDGNATTYLYLLHFKNQWALKENLPDVSTCEKKYYWNLNRDIVKVEIDINSDGTREIEMKRVDAEENTETIDFQVNYNSTVVQDIPGVNVVQDNSGGIDVACQQRNSHVTVDDDPSDGKLVPDRSDVTVIHDSSDGTLVQNRSDVKLVHDSSDVTDVLHILDRNDEGVTDNSSDVTVCNNGSNVTITRNSSSLTDVTTLEQDTSVTLVQDCSERIAVTDRSDGTKVTLVHNGLDVNSVSNPLSIADVSSLPQGTTNQIQLKCPKCEKSCSTKNGLKIHMAVHDERPTCKTCGLSFRTTISLKKHRKTHLRKPFVCCAYCKKLFATQKDLDEHILSHTEVQLNKCQVCYLVFTTSSDLKNHLRSHSAGLKPYICEICKKRFQRRSDLKSHCTTSHWCVTNAIGEEWFG